MTNRSVGTMCVIATVIAIVMLAPAPVAGQVPSAAANTTTAADPPRTPWGDPDLQGQWTGSTLTPLERPEELAGKQFLTEEEAAGLEEHADQNLFVEPVPREGDPGGYNRVWLEPATRLVGDRRTSLIVDPPDGQIPFTPEGRRHNARSSAKYGIGPFDSWLDFDTGERCLTDGLPLRFSGYNANYLILQTPEHLVILGEMFWDRRIIPLDGRPHGKIPQWLGDGRGRWEGETLVVETTNFADKAHYWWVEAWRASRPTLRLIERFTRVDEETIDYQFTMEDPTMFTRHWTAAVPLTTNQGARGVTSGPLYEYACHEGNYALVNILRGARAEEKAHDEAATPSR